MIDQFHHRLSRVENKLATKNSTPTFPKYDVANMPQDPLEAQIVVGNDDSLNWRSNDIWYTIAPNTVIGNPPQDALEGQVAIGSDHSLCWYSNGQWHGVAGATTIGNPPQDSIEGEVAVGSDNGIFWFTDGQWYGAKATGTFVLKLQTPPDQDDADWVQWSGATYTDVYVQNVIWVSQAVVDLVNANPGFVSATCINFVVDLGGGTIGIEGLLAIFNDITDGLGWYDQKAGGAFGNKLFDFAGAEQWYTLDVHLKAGDNTYPRFRVNGVENYQNPNPISHTENVIGVGSVNASNNPVYFKSFKMGTTGYGSSDLYNIDFTTNPNILDTATVIRGTPETVIVNF